MKKNKLFFWEFYENITQYNKRTLKMGVDNIKSNLRKLIKKYLKGRASEDEKAFLNKYYHFFDNEKDILESFDNERIAQIEEKMLNNILSTTKQTNHRTKIIKLIPYKKQIAAAILLILGSFSAYYFLQRNENSTDLLVHVDAKQSEQKEEAVMLTLSDGRKVKLEDVQSGKIAEESGTSITKNKDGSIIYAIKENILSPLTETKYNSINTPNGQISQISLPDGTKVWLNAKSWLKYPVVFKGEQRVIELSGEAYFEVAKNKERPFVVLAKGTEVKVLGTKFNVSAYADDSFTKTTLAEGLVSISKEQHLKLLKPNQQATVLNNQADINIANVDIEGAMAWRNGYFMFNSLDIKAVMTIISRWYDIEIEYRENTENEVFIGSVSKFESLEKLLNTIELTGGVRFKIINQPNKKQRKVVVMP